MITVKYYKHGDSIMATMRATLIPRIGELICISTNNIYEVKNIVWHISECGTQVEIQVA